MNYIVFDMEWNQPPAGAKLEYENDCCLSNEIIQIGAVKIGEGKNFEDTFSVNIRPRKFTQMNHNVKKITGIDDRQLFEGADITDAVRDFRLWCGGNFVFITWGYDDIGVLVNNLKYFGLDAEWLPKCYNLQMIFCAQTENLNKQYSLSYAAEQLGIALDKPLHNALTDAYYTAEICTKLDIELGIRNYNAMVFKDCSIPEHMKNIRYRRNIRSVKSYDDMLELTKIKNPVCCECERHLTDVEVTQNGPFNFLTFGKCSEHGEFAELVKISKNEKNLYFANEMFYSVGKFNRKYFSDKARKMRLSDERRKNLKKNERVKVTDGIQLKKTAAKKAPDAVKEPAANET